MSIVLKIKVSTLHVHIHHHTSDEEALLKTIEELQSKVIADTSSMKDAVDGAKEGTTGIKS